MLLIFIHTTPTVTSTIFSPVYMLGKSQRSYKPKWSQNQIPDSQILCLRIELTHSAVHNLKAQLGTRFHTRPLVQPSLRLRQRTFPAPQEALLLGRPLTQGGGGPGTLTWREMIQKKEYWEGAGYCGRRRELSLGRGEGLSPGARGPCTHPATAWSAGTASLEPEDLSVQRLSRECRSCMSSSAGLSHCRESQSLTRNRTLTSEKEMCLLAQSPRGGKTGQCRAPTGSFKPTL